MTLYEFLSIISPVLTIVVGGLLARVLKGLDQRIDGLDKRIDGLDKRIDGVDNRLSLLEKEVYFIKGLIEGKNSNTPSK